MTSTFQGPLFGWTPTIILQKPLLVLLQQHVSHYIVSTCWMQQRHHIYTLICLPSHLGINLTEAIWWHQTWLWFRKNSTQKTWFMKDKAMTHQLIVDTDKKHTLKDDKRWERWQHIFTIFPTSWDKSVTLQRIWCIMLTNLFMSVCSVFVPAHIHICLFTHSFIHHYVYICMTSASF